MEHITESEFIEHIPCTNPDCLSSDGNSLYSDGHEFCFVCHAHKHRDQAQGKPTHREPMPNPFTNFLLGEYVDLRKRCISATTCATLDYQVGQYQGQACHIAPIHDDKGRLVAQKIRLPNKDFRVLGDLNKGGLVFQHKCAPGGKRLVIVEGEIDALSYATVAPGWQVVSLPNGAAGGPKAIKRALEFCESFLEVVFMLDSDSDGRECALACAALLSPKKAKIATLPLKDANEMLVAGRIAELKTAVYDAKPYSPEGIVLGSELLLDDIKQSVPRGLSVPFLGLNTKIRGLRKGELILVCAGSGIGKSTFTRELGYHLTVAHGQRVGYLMLEESVNKTAKALVAIDNSVPYADLLEDSTLISESEWQSSYEKVVVPSAFYDHFGATEIDNILSKVRYLGVGLGCDFIVLDHVSMVVAGSDKERIALDELMVKLRSLVENIGCGVIAVSHVSRGNTEKSYNDGQKLSLNSLRGSASLEQLSDIVIGLERDQQSETEGDIAQIRVLKSRLVGDVGPCGHIQYDVTTGRMNHHDLQEPPPTSELDPFSEVPF